MNNKTKRRVAKNPTFAAGFRAGVNELFEVLEPALGPDERKLVNRIKRNIISDAFKSAAQEQNMEPLADVEATLLYETEAAMKIEVDGKTAWLDKACLTVNRHPNGDPRMFVIHLPKQLAMDKGIL